MTLHYIIMILIKVSVNFLHPPGPGNNIVVHSDIFCNALEAAFLRTRTLEDVVLVSSDVG